jgi:cytochrome c biogenesis protein CcdA
MPNLIGSLVAIAALDSLNPTAVALQIYLLGTPQPVARSIAFILGVFLAYWTAGLSLVLGLGQLLSTVISAIDFAKYEVYLYGLQLLLGIVLLVVGFTLKSSTEPDRNKIPKKLTAGRTFLLGLAVTIWEFPTALPYLAALEQISRAKLDPVAIMSVLGIYNSIFVLPLIILLGIYLRFHHQSAELLHRINRAIARWSPKILRVLLVGLGLLLVIDSLAYSVGRSFLKFAQLS